MRPKSIEHFAMVYAAIILAGLASTALSWSDMMSQVSVQQMTAQFGTAIVYIVAGVGLAIQLLLWFFIARRGSVIAKWIFVVLTALAVISGIWGLATTGASSPIIGILGVVMLVLQVIAIWLLFSPDTPAWFGEAPAE
jgi:hypothetical protein